MPYEINPNCSSMSEEDIFEVEKIVSHKTVNGVTYFQIRWKGYPPEEDTFEPIENLNCPEIIRQYFKSLSSTQKEESDDRQEKKESSFNQNSEKTRSKD